MPTGKVPPRLTSRAAFTLPYVLLLVVILGVLTSAAARSYSTHVRREKEEELLFVGRQYADAVGRYYRFQNKNQYPRSVENLLKDSRMPNAIRHLRRKYLDPITGEEFVPIRTKEGWFLGVRSASEAAPIKTAGFPPGLEIFAGRTAYKDWDFVYRR